MTDEKVVEEQDSLISSIFGVFKGLISISVIVTLVVEFTFVIASIVISLISMLFLRGMNSIVDNIKLSLMYGGVASGIIIAIVIIMVIKGIVKSIANDT